MSPASESQRIDEELARYQHQIPDKSAEAPFAYSISCHLLTWLITCAPHNRGLDILDTGRIPAGSQHANMTHVGNREHALLGNPNRFGVWSKLLATVFAFFGRPHFVNCKKTQLKCGTSFPYNPLGGLIGSEYQQFNKWGRVPGRVGCFWTLSTSFGNQHTQERQTLE